MNRRITNALKVGLVCGIALVLFTFIAYGVTEAIFKEMTKPPAPIDGMTPTPVGNLSEGITALILDFVMLTVGSMLILAAGGALYAWTSRGSHDSVGETIKWSLITGVLSYIAYVIITVVLVIAAAAISLLVSGDLSWVSNNTFSGAAASQICCFPVTVLIWALGVMAAAIGGFTCAAYVLKQG